MLTQSEVSSLYVALFGRASEGEGNEYWQSFDSLEEAAQAMLETSDSQDYFGDTLSDNQAFIESIYANTLNKTIEDDPEGIAYWTELLNNGATKGEIAAQLVDAIETYAPGAENYDPTDEATVYAYNQFENRVKISNITAENIESVPEDYKISLGFDEDLVVTGDDTIDTLYTIEEELAQTYDFEADITDLLTSPFQESTMTSEMKQYGKDTYDEAQQSTGDQDILNNIEIDTTPLTENDIDSLSHMYQEEKLAMDVYTALAELYPNEEVFTNIAEAEASHLESVSTLMDQLNVDTTSLDALAPGEFEDSDLQALYDSLIETGSQSLEDALNVGVLVEETDIADLDSYLSNVTNTSIIDVYNGIEDGSYSHLDAFTSVLDGEQMMEDGSSEMKQYGKDASTIAETAAADAAETAETAAETAETAAETAETAADDVTETAETAADDVAETAETAADDAAETAETAADNVAETAETAADDVAETAETDADDVAETAETDADDATDIVTAQMKQYGKDMHEDDNDMQDIMNNIDTTPLTEDDLEGLSHMYQEEKLAMDVYTALGDIYDDEEIFTNIADAEENHLESVATLMDQLNVDTTSLDALAPGEFEDSDLQALYDSLIETGSQSLEDALNVGVLIEQTDIADLDEYIGETTNATLVGVYNSIENGSYNHLDAFNQAIAQQDISHDFF